MTTSAEVIASVAAATSVNDSSSLAPSTTMIEFAPVDSSTQMGATPVDAVLLWDTALASMPTSAKFAR